MKLIERINLAAQLGSHLLGTDEYLEAVMKRTEYNNQWFTFENQQQAIRSIADSYLNKEKLTNWVSQYDFPEYTSPRSVGLILAGNIPLVGFHDVLSVFVAGHKSVIKLSDKDPYLLPYLVKLLNKFDSRSEGYFEFVEKLNGFEAVIATGSNNSSRYFEAYFGKYPNIIRKNRNGIAILNGEESKEDLLELGKDIFQYYGLGCRNVSKIYVPNGYEFTPLLETLHEYKKIVLNNKYKNNFDYNFALNMMNKVPMQNNGCLILTEDKAIQSRIASLHYEYYDSIDILESHLNDNLESIQCIVAKDDLLSLNSFSFGHAQKPALADYADGVDTLEFLKEL